MWSSPALLYLILTIVANASALRPVEQIEIPPSPHVVIDPLLDILQQAHRAQVDQSSTVPPRQVPRPDSLVHAQRGSGSADQILDEGMHQSTGPASATLSDDLAAHPTDKPSTLLHWLANCAGTLANWLAGASGSSAQQAKSTLLQLSKDKDDKENKGGEGGSGGAPIGLIAAGFGGVCLVLFVVVLSAVWMRKSRAREKRLKRQQSDYRRVERQLSKNSAPKLFQSMDLKHEGNTNGSGSAVAKDGLKKATSENLTSNAVARTQSERPEESLLPNADTIMHISAQATRHQTDPVDELVIGAIVRHEERGEGELIEIDLDNPMDKPYLVIFKGSGHTHRYTRQQLKDKFQLHRILPSDTPDVAGITPSAPPSVDTKPSFKRRGGAIQTTEVATHVDVDVNAEHEVSHHTLDYLPGDDPPRIGPTLVVHVDSARNLTAKDDNGTSDPFCKVEYGKETRKTNICLKTLNPAWHATFRFELQYRAQLLLTVWDDDTNEGGTEKDNDFLGKLEFKPQKLQVLKEASLADASVTCDEWYPLHKRSMMSNISGDIRIRLTWEDFRDL